MKFRGVGYLNGQYKEISLEADTKEQAIMKMKQQRYTNISVVEKASFFSFQGVKSKDVTMVFRQLAAFAEAGEGFTKSLANVADVTQNKVLKESLIDIKKKIEGGMPIATAFSEHSVYPKIVVNLLKVGESSGEMEKTLDELAKYLEQRNNIEQGVKSAMMYPKVITAVMVLAMIFVVMKVLPQFKTFYTDMHIEMPLVTKILYAFSDFLSEQWYIAFPALFLVGYFIKNIPKYMPEAYDATVIRLPIIKGLMINLYMFRFCKTFQILSSSNVEILDTLKLTGETMENHLYSQPIEKSIPLVKAGESISSSIKKNDIKQVFDPMVIAFLYTGESTNNIPDLMDKAANYYQKNLNRNIDDFGKAIEPILLCIIALFVFVLVSSIYLPIFRMSQIAGQS